MSDSPVPRGKRDLAAESMFEFGSRVGIWRILELFATRKLPMTAFACAMVLERLPAVAAALREAGHDICCHGWRWVEHYLLSEDEERRHIAMAVESLSRTMGRRPAGWYCRYGPSVNTRRLVHEHGGFLYDSDTYNDELPYYVTVGDRPHLVVPYSLSTNDVKFHRGNIGTAADFAAFLQDAFDQLYEEGASCAEDDVSRHACPPARSSRTGARPCALSGLCPGPSGCLDLPARGDRAPLADRAQADRR